jgi:hypothetical protein
MRKLLIMVLLGLILSACGGNNEKPTQTSEPTATSAPSPTPDMAPPPEDLPTYDLEPNNYRLTIEGALTGDDNGIKKLRSSPGLEYGPAVRYLRNNGTNTVGNVGLLLRAGVAPEGGTDTNLGLMIVLEFDPAIGPGEYSPGSKIEVRGWANKYDTFEATEGTIIFDFVNRNVINGSLDLTLTNDDDQTITAQGAFHNVAYTPEPEHALVVTGVTPMASSDGIGRSAIGSGVTISMSLKNDEGQTGEVNLVFSYDVEPGEYDITDEAGLVKSGPIVLAGQEATAVTGTVNLSTTTPYFNGTVDLAVETEAGLSNITGTFAFFSSARP